jgi:DEAD/DEAH box helicase domain-containing protein
MAQSREGFERLLIKSNSMKSFVETLKRSSIFGPAVVHHEYIPPREPDFDEPAGGFPEPIRRMLSGLAITHLYRHQARAVEFIRQGKSVMVATPTASGKTMIYSLPVLEAMLQDPSVTALYLFPLKALEQDQWRALKEMCAWLEPEYEVASAIYDGDTTPYARKKIKYTPPNIVISNPDMLHMGILSFHQGWEKFLRRLRFVIIDEVHTYRGIFGSHVAQVIKRLHRMCRFYGSDPIYLLSSATVANPLEFSAKLTDRIPELICESGAPAAGRHFLFMNPDSSAAVLSARLFYRCLSQGFKTIAFTQSRRMTELMHMWVSQMAPEFKNRLSSYRAGFLPEERRTIERDMSSGRLLGVISTSALEMGIDIGGLDVCILVGYPGTMITTWQRGGRVGRSEQESLIVLVAQPDALDQYFMRHPERFFARGFESAVVDPNNRDVLKAHIPCAAAEEPIVADDPFYSQQKYPLPFQELEQTGRLLRSADMHVWFCPTKRPHREVNIRSVGESYAILKSGTKSVIGTVDGFRVFTECHQGAIYLHKATQYVVDRLDLEKRNVSVTPVQVSYYTRPMREKETEILSIQRSRPTGNFLVKQGYLRVTEHVTGFEKRRVHGQELISTHVLDLPDQVFETVGIWIEIEDVIRNMIAGQGLHFMGGIHALEHAAIAMFPLLTLCDRNDVGGISYPFHPQIGKSAVFIYDGYPGGVGLSEKGFDVIDELLERTWELVLSCDCADGCPSCIHSPKCGSGNKPLDKAACRLALELLLGKELLEVAEERQHVGQAAHIIKPEPHDIPAVTAKVAILDLETQRSAQEVGGWHNSHLMRVAVAVLYGLDEGRFYTFFENDVRTLLTQLKSYDLVVGFNIRKFDYSVLQAYALPGELKKIPTFDICEYVNKKLGYRLSLNHLAQKTLHINKTADGLQSLVWFKAGEMDKVADYCKSDVEITRDLFLHGLERGYLLFENRDGTLLRLVTSWDIGKLKEGKWE